MKMGRRRTVTGRLPGNRILPLLLAACIAGCPFFSCSESRAADAAPSIPPWPADPADQLHRQGVSTFSKGALSNIVIRGYQRENIMVLFDGAPFFGAAPIRIDAPPFHFNYPDIGSIVVTKGPYNLAYPGGAGGTVEVTGPRNPSGVHGRAMLTYGSSDAVSGAAYLSAAGSKADMGVGYAYRTAHVPESGDGRLITSVSYPNPNNAYQQDEQDRTMFRNQTFWLRGGITPTSRSRLDLAYTYQEGEAMLTPTLPFDVPYEQAHRMTARFTLREISPLVSEVLLQGWMGRATILIDDSLRKTADPDNGTLPYRAFLSRPYASRMDLTADTTGGRVEARLNLGSADLKSGIDFYQRDWTGDYSWLANINGWKYQDDQVLIPDASTRNVGLYAILETPLTQSLRLVAALRGDFARITADDINSSLEDYYQTYHGNRAIPRERNFSSPGANVQILYSPATGVEFFLKGGQSNRLPDTHEMYLTQMRQGSNLVGNPFLKAPRVAEADAGFRLSSDRAGLEVTLFYSDVKDYILPAYTDPDGVGPMRPARTAGNVDADISGIETEGYLVPIKGLRLSGGLSYGRGENRTTGNPLAEMQPLRGVLSLRYDAGRFFASVTENMAARQDRIDPLLKETESSGFAVTNLRAGYRIGALSVTGGVNNLFDKQYYLPLAYMRDPVNPSVRIPETGRNWFLTASCRF